MVSAMAACAFGGDVAGRITALEPQRRSGRFNLYLDGDFAFGVAESLAARLRIGEWLSDEAIAALKAEDEVERARELALGYLTPRPRSEAEMRRYLAGKGFSTQAIETVLERLRAVGLVDDLAFARFWIENRLRFRPRGRRGLWHELRQKGIDEATLEAALADYDELETARRFAEGEWRRLASQPEALRRHRLSERLARRGFAYETIRCILDDLPHPHPIESEDLEP